MQKCTTLLVTLYQGINETCFLVSKIEFAYDNIDIFLTLETKDLEGEPFMIKKGNLEMYGIGIPFLRRWKDWPGMGCDQLEVCVSYGLGLINLLRQKKHFT